jgi:hypothetical protein
MGDVRDCQVRSNPMVIGMQFDSHPTSHIYHPYFCGGGEMVDAGDLKSPPGNRVRVRVPPLAF